MIRRLFTLGIVAAILVGGDVAARGFVSATVERRAQQEAPSGSSVSADVGGFPFLPTLLLGGNVSTASVHVENIKAKLLVFSTVDIDLSGVHLDRGRLINDRKARITKIDHGTIRAIVTAESLSDALHVPVTMQGGHVTIAGLNVTPSVRDRQLTIGGFRVPLTDYMPCVTDVTVEDQKMELSCEIHDVPPALLDAVQNGIGA
ncbi:MAG: hypothetical protein QOK28_1660 [Actinomycetota bacterium]|jgi:hypothetical protein